MKLDACQLRTIALAIAPFFIVAAKVHSQPFPLLTMSNAIPTSSPAATKGNPADNTNALNPLIEMDDMPISQAIEVLARSADINYLVDTRLSKWWTFPDLDGHATHEPIVTFHWKNLTSKEALLRLLKEHNLVLFEDAITSVARITYVNQIVNTIDANLLGSDTNLIPVIQFWDVPITTALQNLARQAGVNYMLDPKIGYGQPDKNGKIREEPLLTFRWENITAKQGLAALFKNYDLVISNNPANRIILISDKKNPVTNFVDASLLGSDTNIIPVIQFQNVPLNTGLRNLAEQIHYDNNIEIALDPSIDNVPSNKFSPMPTLTLRWENVTAKQAIVALCDNYDLIIVKDSETGVIQIKPKD
jgi:hypothetical protein